MKQKQLIYSFILLSILVSCTRVIDIDLNSSNPRLIVEANIHSNPGPYTVRLSRSVNFSDPNVFPAATGATVIISDDFSNIDTLQEVTPGIYQTTFIQGMNNRNYYLYINDNGNIHTAQSFINPTILLDSVVSSTFPNPIGGAPFILITPYFNDPAGVANYYKINEVINDTAVRSIRVSDDNSFNGETYNRPLINRSLGSGDTVSIELLSIDKYIYAYYFGFAKLSGFGINQSATPANPVSNITGANVLGYFNAYSADKKTIVVP